MKGSVFLPAYEQAFLDDCEELLPAIIDHTATQRIALAFCTSMRRAAIAALMRSGRTATFRRRLQRSGSAYLYYLARPAGDTPRTSAASPYLDAVAAGDLATADQIALLSSHLWSANDEYEEDFLYYEFLMVHAIPAAPIVRASALLDRWEACLSGSEDARLPICRALIGHDATEFDSALLDYLGAREREQREQLATLEPEAAATEASISIEGIALRQIAARSGLAITAEHPQVPVPLELSSDWAPESFRAIE
jgi:hypothetical protein